MKKCPFMAENDLTKKGRIAYDYSLDESTIINLKKKKWDSLHARLNSHYKAWSYKKKKHKKIKVYRKSV